MGVNTVYRYFFDVGGLYTTYIVNGCKMKLAWIRWAGGIETRDDGYVIYHDPRFVMLRRPGSETLEKFRTSEDAKRSIDAYEKSLISV